MYHNIKIVVENSYDDMSLKAAQVFADSLKNNPRRAFGFATGSTPVGLYKELVRMHKEENLDFSEITAFNLDEYYPLSRNSEYSYYYFMQQHLFSQINIEQSRVFLPDGKAEDADEECRQYEEKILQSGGVVTQILGIGLNGHIGFNEPSESFGANTRLVPLAEITINANSKHFPNSDDMPRHAITMGIRTIMMARHIILLVNGSAKAGILRDSFLGPITPLVPASALQLHPSVTVVADKEAATLL